MDEPLRPSPTEHPEDTSDEPVLLQTVPSPHDRHRKAVLRRLGVLFAAAATAFVLTTWLLMRVEPPGKGPREVSAPAKVVRAQLEALGHGELGAAYALFSQHYRDRVPFAVFRERVAAHRELFRARRVEIWSREDSKTRAVVETQIFTADGERYLAHYTLVAVEGQWWIDDLRWGREPDSRGHLTARLERAVAP